MKTVTFTEKEFKSILIVRKLIDHWFWQRYGINPYNGCQFGCLYCDSRSSKYYLPSDFENSIIVKKNVKTQLENRLSRARTLLPDVTGIGGTTDPYQPAETLYKNTRQCLEVLLEHRYPASICTKSRLVTRDIDLLDEIGKQTWSCVAVTITSPVKTTARYLEQRAPDPDLRFKVISAVKSNSKHIQAGILLMPTVPFLTDKPEDIETIVRKGKDSGADFIMFGSGMTLRDQQAGYFLKDLSVHHPELIKEYEKIYQFRYSPDFYGGQYAPSPDYQKKVNDVFFSSCEKYGMPFRMKRYIPADFRRDNYRIAEKLLDLSYSEQINGKAWSHYFWAGQNIQNLKESVRDIASRNELKKIRGIGPKLDEIILKELKTV